MEQPEGMHVEGSELLVAKLDFTLYKVGNCWCVTCPIKIHEETGPRVPCLEVPGMRDEDNNETDEGKGRVHGVAGVGHRVKE